MKTLNDILTGFLAADFEISLSKPQLALVLLVYHRLYASESQGQDIAERELASFFNAIDRLGSNDPAGAQARARGAIAALQKARVIVRSDYGGLSAPEPIYSMTSLGRAIAENITRQVEFDKDTLRSILSEAIVRLSEVAAKGTDCKSAEDWRRHVIVPLKEFIEGAFERILRFQSTLDIRHEAVRDEIFTLVQSKAEQAIDPCVMLLEQSMQTIRELRDTLLDMLIKTDEITLELLVKARDAEQREAMAAADGILKRTSQIAEWTGTRVQAWSLHYQNVHSFLRHVVRVDPDRKVAERLKNTIRQFCSESACITICREPNVSHLNETFLQPPPQRPTRKREDFSIESLDVAEAAHIRLADDICSKVDEQLQASGTSRLTEVLKTLNGVRWNDLHRATGVAMQQILKTRKVQLTNQFTWVPVRGSAEIQEIEIHR